MDQASQTITIVSVIFGGVISLLIYIWNQNIKINDRRHEMNEKLIGELTRNSTEQRILLEKLNTMIAHHESVIDKLT